MIGNGCEQLRFCFADIVRNPGGCAALRLTNAGATPSGLRLREKGCVLPGLPKRNPGLELANAFSVIHSRAFTEPRCGLNNRKLESARAEWLPR